MSTIESAPADAGGVSVSDRDRLLEQADQAARLGARIEDPPEAIYYELKALRLTLSAALQPPAPRADRPPEIKDGWYAIGLMGHRTRVGYVRPVLFAGRGLVEVREPAHTGTKGGGEETSMPERIEYYSPAAIFSLEPSTETDVLEQLSSRDSFPF